MEASALPITSTVMASMVGAGLLCGARLMV
jgi:hypothetical protein